MLEHRVIFFERPYPSGNAVLLTGPAPVLVDPGFGSDTEMLQQWLHSVEVPPERLALVVNTHYHSDHVGGNHVLQREFDLAVAAHEHDAGLINGCDATACASFWLRQPVESYRVNRELQEGDVIETGDASWSVLHTPGHTLGHISLYNRATGALIAGDTFHASDVGWLNPFLEGEDVLGQSTESVQRLSSLKLTIAFSGHGPAIDDPGTALASALRRFQRWRNDPEAAAWHAVKRIFAYALMIEGGLDADAVDEYLDRSPWLHASAAQPFGTDSHAFAKDVLSEMLRSGAARWQDGRLIANSSHRPTDSSWPRSPTTPDQWPRWTA